MLSPGDAGICAIRDEAMLFNFVLQLYRAVTAARMDGVLIGVGVGDQ
jgi:hypothetical protein